MIERETVVYLFRPKPPAPEPGKELAGFLLVITMLVIGIFMGMVLHQAMLDDQQRTSNQAPPTPSGTPAQPASMPSGPPPSFTTR